MASIYDFKALTSRGKELDFAQFEGKTIQRSLLPPNPKILSKKS